MGFADEFFANRIFRPSTFARAVNELVVNPALPVKSVSGLIALAKSKPGGLNYGSSGTGASNHLAAEMFRTMARVDIVRVKYKGAGPALTALIAGELQLMFPSGGAAVPHVRAGRVKAEVTRLGKVIKDAGIRGNQEVVSICKSV